MCGAAVSTLSFDPDGTAAPRVAPARSPTRNHRLIARHEGTGLLLDEHTMPVGGERDDLDLTVDVLLAAASGPR
ncbi:MAG: hypothetical protein ACRD6W_18810 [Nitrososphaerales archaeon]